MSHIVMSRQTTDGGETFFSDRAHATVRPLRSRREARHRVKTRAELFRYVGLDVTSTRSRGHYELDGRRFVETVTFEGVRRARRAGDRGHSPNSGTSSPDSRTTRPARRDESTWARRRWVRRAATLRSGACATVSASSPSTINSR